MKIFEKRDYSSNGAYCYYYLFGKNIGRRNDNCYYFFNDLYTCWHDWTFEITYGECGYEDPYGRIDISLFGCHSVFKMPWKSKKLPYGDCDIPQWGIAVHNNTFWIYRGGKGNMNGGSKWWTWDLPFFTYIHMNHLVECNLGTDEEPNILMVNSKSIEKIENKWIPMEENPMVYKRNYLYTDSYDGSKIPCTYWVEEREWRPKWLTWTKKFRKVRKYIEVSFSQEVGERKGSWKGGCMGCLYDLKENESPEMCIKRMENERKF